MVSEPRVSGHGAIESMIFVEEISKNDTMVKCRVTKHVTKILKIFRIS